MGFNFNDWNYQRFYDSRCEANASMNQTTNWLCYRFQSEQVKLKALQDNAKEIEQRADVASRQMIQESYTALAQQWRLMEDNLLQNISHLIDLADTWEVT